MDKGQYKKLNSFHVIFLIHMSMSGIGLLSLPHDGSAMGYNIWFLPIILGAFVQITIIPMIILGKKFPSFSFYEINEKLLGKWIGKPIAILFIIYGIVAVAAISERYLNIIQTITLVDQSLLGPTIILFLIMIYIVNGGIKAIARFCIVGFFLVIWMIYYLQWGLMKGVYTQLLPMFDFSGTDILESVKASSPSIMGFELILFYFPYIMNQKKALKHVSIGIWLTMAIYTSICFTSAVYFSKWQLENLRYPVLNLYKAVELTFIERIENLGITLWVFLILATLVLYLWVAKKGLDSLLKKDRKLHQYLCAAIAAFLVIHPLFDPFEREIFKLWSQYFALFMFCYPIFLLLLSLIKNRKGKVQ